MPNETFTIDQKLAELQRAKKNNYELYRTGQKPKKDFEQSIIEEQALLSLKEANGGGTKITQEVLDEAKDKERFCHTMFNVDSLGGKPFTAEEYKFMIDEPQKLHELSKDVFQKHPGMRERRRLMDEKEMFDEKKPTNGFVNNYSAGRGAIHSIAMLSIARKHQEEIQKGTWTIDDLYKPENLQERKDAYKEVWKKIQDGDHKWIAEHIFEGMKASTELCENAVKQINWKDPDILNNETYQRMINLQQLCFDAGQELDRGCAKEAIEYVNDTYKANLPLEPANRRVNTIQTYMETQENLTFLGSGLYKSLGELYKASAQALVKKASQTGNIDLKADCQTAASSVEIINEINNRIAAHGSIIRLENEFTLEEFPEEKQKEIINKANDEVPKNKEQLKNIEALLQLEQDPGAIENLEQEKKKLSVENVINNIIRQEPVSQQYPPLSSGMLNNMQSNIVRDFNTMMDGVKEDKTGTIGGNLINDILSGEFSKKNGGHLPVKVEEDFSPHMKEPMTRAKLVEEYGQGLEKKHIWEEKRVCEILKFNQTAMVFVGDLRDRHEKDNLGEECMNQVQQGRINNGAFDGDTQEKMDRDYGAYNYKELRKTEGGKLVIMGDGGSPVIDDSLNAGFDPEAQEEAYNKLKDAIRRDMRRYPDPKINEIRKTSLQLMDTPAEEYGHAMFGNSHLPKIATIGMSSLQIDLPVSTLKKELGENTFNTLADMRAQANKEILTTIETEKLLAKSPEERRTEQYKKDEMLQLHKIWNTHRKTLESFDALSRLDDKLYDVGEGRNRLANSKEQTELDANNEAKPVMMANTLKELTKNNRGPSAAMGWIRGEKKAIENGWGLEELGMLGMIGRLEVESGGSLPDTLAGKDGIENMQKEFRKDLAELKQKVWDKPVKNDADKKAVAQEIKNFIDTQKEKNLMTQELFSVLPMDRISAACDKTAGLAVDPRAAQHAPVFNTQQSVTNHLSKAFQSSHNFGPFLTALTEVSSRPEFRDRCLKTSFCNSSEGKKYLVNLSRVLIDKLDEQRKHINERIDQLSQEIKEKPQLVPEQYKDHLDYEPLRKQLAYNMIKDSETVKQFEAHSKLKDELLNSSILPEDIKQQMKAEMQKKHTAHASDRSYHFGSKTEYTKAIKDDNSLDLAQLKKEANVQNRRIEMYDEKMRNIVRLSKDCFNNLQATLNNENNLSARSGEFLKMFNAVQAVSELNETKTPAQIDKAINDMVEASQAYVKKNDAIFKSGAGRSRLNAAKQILKEGKNARLEMVYGATINNTTKELKSNGLSSMFIDRNKSLEDNMIQFSTSAAHIPDVQAPQAGQPQRGQLQAGRPQVGQPQVGQGQPQAGNGNQPQAGNQPARGGRGMGGRH